MHEGIAQLAELYPNCFRQLRQPLKIGIHNDINARHLELQPGLIASALRTYTRSVGYLETLKSGAPRIDLEGNPVGTVTAADEGDAERKIAKAARRAAAKAIEERKGKSATVADLPSSPVAATPQPIAPAGPPRLGPQGGRTGSPGGARRREVIQALWLARSRAACRYWLRCPRALLSALRIDNFPGIID